MKLNNRVAVITGAASGIGRATAIRLAGRGCHLALADLDAAGAEQTALQARQLGVRATSHRLDVASREEVRGFPATVQAAHGGADILINNAGVALGGRFEQVSEDDFDWLMEINFHAVVRMTRAFMPMLRASDDARLVYLSSIYGIVAPPGQTAYSASKFAVRGFANSLRHELAGTNIGVTVVHPGGVATSIVNNARIPSGARPDEVERNRKIAQRLLRLQPEKAAAIIVDGIERRRERVLVGSDAKAASWLERLVPVSYWKLMKKATSR